MNLSKRSWILKPILIITVLVLLSPVFAWGAKKVNYSEPLENVAEKADAVEDEETINSGLFPDYSIPGFENNYGIFVAGILGSIATLGLAYGIGKAVKNE